MSNDMPDKVFLSKHGDWYIARESTQGVKLITGESPFFSESHVQQLIKEAEERQRILTFNKTMDVLRDFKEFRHWHDNISPENEEFILNKAIGESLTQEVSDE